MPGAHGRGDSRHAKEALAFFFAGRMEGRHMGDEEKPLTPDDFAELLTRMASILKCPIETIEELKSAIINRDHVGILIAHRKLYKEMDVISEFFESEEAANLDDAVYEWVAANHQSKKADIEANGGTKVLSLFRHRKDTVGKD